MKHLLIIMFIVCCLPAASAQGPGEGECSSEFLHKFRKIQKCTEAGVCTSRTSGNIEIAGFLSCGAPWGDLMRVCFKSGECIDGMVTTRKTTEGDRLHVSIFQNNLQFGGYPKKFALAMTIHADALPYQLTLYGGKPARYTELLFGEFGSASLSSEGRGKGSPSSRRDFFARPARPLLEKD